MSEKSFVNTMHHFTVAAAQPLLHATRCTASTLLTCYSCFTATLNRRKCANAYYAVEHRCFLLQRCTIFAICRRTCLRARYIFSSVSGCCVLTLNTCVMHSTGLLGCTSAERAQDNICSTVHMLPTRQKCSWVGVVLLVAAKCRC